jgi:hypothetical protein
VSKVLYDGAIDMAKRQEERRNLADEMLLDGVLDAVSNPRLAKKVAKLRELLWKR